MPFCPKCHAEYRSDVTHCADDGEKLVETLQNDMTEVALEAVYASYNEIEADRIRSLLEDEGVPCYVRGLRRAAFPTQAGTEAPNRIAVPTDQTERAIELIKQARADDIVSTDGAFLK